MATMTKRHTDIHEWAAAAVRLLIKKCTTRAAEAQRWVDEFRQEGKR
jgi:hypothetical protein